MRPERPVFLILDSNNLSNKAAFVGGGGVQFAGVAGLVVQEGACEGGRFTLTMIPTGCVSRCTNSEDGGQRPLDVRASSFTMIAEKTGQRAGLVKANVLPRDPCRRAMSKTRCRPELGLTVWILGDERHDSQFESLYICALSKAPFSYLGLVSILFLTQIRVTRWILLEISYLLRT